MSMRVRELMTSPVHTIGPEVPAWEAVGLMRSHRIRRLPVVEGEQLVGIVTWTDLVRVRPPVIGGRWAVPNLTAGVLVRHLMTPEPVTITPETLIEQAAAIMRRRKVGGLPVIEDGQLIGIVTESDVFEAFVDIFSVRPHEVRLHVPVLSLIVEVPRLVTELARAGVPILSLHTLRVHGTEAVDLVVHDRDEHRARGVIRTLTLQIDAGRPLEHSVEG